MVYWVEATTGKGVSPFPLVPREEWVEVEKVTDWRGKDMEWFPQH